MLQNLRFLPLSTPFLSLPSLYPPFSAADVHLHRQHAVPAGGIQ